LLQTQANAEARNHCRAWCVSRIDHIYTKSQLGKKKIQSHLQIATGNLQLRGFEVGGRSRHDYDQVEIEKTSY
jgi:hypothetical protein